MNNIISEIDIIVHVISAILLINIYLPVVRQQRPVFYKFVNLSALAAPRNMNIIEITEKYAQ